MVVHWTFLVSPSNRHNPVNLDIVAGDDKVADAE